MALNLSRNTKVFVSSVNGVPTAGGQFLTGYIKDGGAGYAVGDRLNFNNSVSGIVELVSSGAVTKLNINSNGVGNGMVDGADLVEDTAFTLAGADAGASSTNECDVEVISAGVTTGVTTSEGSRAATGRFVGNGDGANTFRIGVLDGYSFSQGSESTDVTITEAGASPSRGSKRFNDSLPPAEWSFATYVRPFIHGTNSWRVARSYDMCENILWNALAGTAITTAVATTNAVVCQVDVASPYNGTTVAKGGNVTFANSNAHELLKLNLYFVMENTTYRLNDAQIGTAEIDFSIDGIAQITWSGSATTIDQVETATEDPFRYISVLYTDGSTNTQTSVLTPDASDTYTESYTFVDSTGPNDADYLRNKLSALYLNIATAQGGGAASQGLDAKKYDINITGGSISVENNVTYVTPETIGIVDKPIGSFTGARTVSGSLTMYLDNKDNGSNNLLSDLAGASDLISNSFDMSLLMGQNYRLSTLPGASRADNAHAANDFVGPGVEFFMPKCHLTIPTIEVADLISVSVEFSAQGSSLLTKDEMSVKYFASTTHSQAGYFHNDTGDINVVNAAN